MNNRNELTMTRHSILAVFRAASVLAAGAAQAQNRIMAVRVGDLNVAAEQGARVALHLLARRTMG
jgi:hypothetical protein